MPTPLQMPLTLGQDIQGLIAQLGVQAGERMAENGLLPIDEPLVEAIVAHGEEAILPLMAFFTHPQESVALAEGIYAAQRLAENGVKGVDTLYGPLSRYNASPDALIQIYLAGFYRTIDEPAAFGPLLGTLIHHSLRHYPAQGEPNTNIIEEVGGAILQILARESAKETVKMLLPYLAQLQTPQPATNAFQTPTP